MKRYSISDGKLLLTIEEAEEGGFIVTSPIDPGLITEAETISECFEMARDAMKELQLARQDLRRKIGVVPKRKGRKSA